MVHAEDVKSLCIRFIEVGVVKFRMYSVHVFRLDNFFYLNTSTFGSGSVWKFILLYAIVIKTIV